jgi:uncharacterized membrane protein YcaP (DUF421 family)
LGEQEDAMEIWTVDWSGLFRPKHSLAELVVRGTIMYLVVVALLRLDMRRQVGGIAMPDILVVVLIAEIAGRGITLEYESVIEGTVLIGTILFWSYLFERLQFRFPAIERLLRAKKLALVQDGRILHRNMRAEAVTREELTAQLREHGVEDHADVKVAYLEADGRISVIKHDKASS